MRTTVLSILLGLLYIVPAFAADAADPSALPPERLAAQMVMAGFRGMHARDADLLDEIRQGLVGGVVLFDKDLSLDGAPRNIRDADQVRSLVAGLQAALPPDAPPLLVAVDQEGGRVMRLKPQYGFPDLPAAKELGTQSPDASRRAGAVAGRTLADLGVNVNFAPVVDVDANPHSPAIGALGRSFSADPRAVAERAGAFMDGLLAHGVAPCLKHFPGHGSSRADSHLGLTEITDTWSRTELLPYRLLLDGSRPAMVMTAHVFHAGLDAEHPATLSRAVVTGLLRRELGFDGVVVSDDLQMGAVRDRYGLRETVRLAVNAGVDVLLVGNNLHYEPLAARTLHQALLDLLDSGEVSRERLERSYRRITRLKSRLERSPAPEQ